MWLLMTPPYASPPISNPSTNLLILPPKYFLQSTVFSPSSCPPWLLPDSGLLAWHSAKLVYCHRILVRENTVFICRAPSKENTQLMLKGPKLPVGLHARVFKDNIRAKSCWVCDWLMTILLIGWWQGDIPGISIIGFLASTSLESECL